MVVKRQILTTENSAQTHSKEIAQVGDLRYYSGETDIQKKPSICTQNNCLTYFLGGGGTFGLGDFSKPGGVTFGLGVLIRPGGVILGLGVFTRPGGVTAGLVRSMVGNDEAVGSGVVVAVLVWVGVGVIVNVAVPVAVTMPGPPGGLAGGCVRINSAIRARLATTLR